MFHQFLLIIFTIKLIEIRTQIFDNCVEPNSKYINLKLFKNRYFHQEVFYSIDEINKRNGPILGSFKDDDFNQSISICLQPGSIYNISFNSFTFSENELILKVCNEYFIDENKNIIIEITDNNKCKILLHHDNSLLVDSFNKNQQQLIASSSTTILNSSINQNITAVAAKPTYELSQMLGNPSGSTNNGTYLCNPGSYVQFLYGYNEDDIVSLGMYCSDGNLFDPTPANFSDREFITSTCLCGFNEAVIITDEYVHQLIPFGFDCSKNLSINARSENYNLTSFSCSLGKYLVGFNWYSSSFLQAIELICGGENDNSIVEKETLSLFFEALDGPSWNTSQNWLSDKPLSCWYGITLDNEGYVKSIILEWNNLKGTLIDEIRSLKHLTILQLGYNHITGTIPSVLSNLSFTQIILNDNLFTGTVPYQIYDLSTLEFLILDTCRLSGQLPNSFRDLFQINRFSISKNLITGTISNDISLLQNISILYLDFNYLTGFIPDSIFDLTNLQELDLNTNLLQGSISNSIGQMIYLKEFIYATNEISGSIPYSITTITTLSILDLQSNVITGKIPLEIFNITGLQLLLHYNFLTGNIIYETNSLLSTLNLGNNYLTGNLKHISTEDLRIDLNYFTGKAPSIDVAGITYYLDYCFFTGSIPNITSYNHIRTFVVNDNFFSGTIPKVTHFVYEIYLQNNLLSGSLPINMIENVKYSIRVQNNFLTGQILIGQISNSFRSSEILSFGNNYFTGPIDEFICYQAGGQLRNFQVGNNYLTGPWCQNYSDWNIQYLIISDNLFTGVILNSFAITANSLIGLVIANNFYSGDLGVTNLFLGDNSLLELDLGYNLFSGTIPNSFGTLYQLASLAIAGNIIDGTLPQNFYNLTNLRLLDITGLDMCYYSSLARAVLGASSGNLYRCQDMQDIAVCSLRYQSEIYQTISNYDVEITTTRESNHLYESNIYQIDTVYVPNAYYFTIVFDEWSHTELDFDFVCFCSDNKCDVTFGCYDGTAFPGVGSMDPLIIVGDRFYYRFESDNSVEYWGYFFTITAVVPRIGWSCVTPPNISFPLSIDTVESYGLLYNQSYAVDFCGNDEWEGIECTYGVVTSLSFGSYGIPGTIPSVISLLTNLEEIYFTYNSLTGTIPESFTYLSYLQILDLSNNKLTGTIPSTIGKLSSVQQIILFSNFLSGTLSESLQLTNQSLQKLLLSGNKLSGKLDSSLCSLKNASIDISGNDLTCFDSCWSTAPSLKSNIDVCSPTNYPTSTPTAPTFAPTTLNYNSNIDDKFFIIMSAIVGSILIITFYCFTFRLNLKEKKLKLLKDNALKKLPIHRSIINNESETKILQLIEFCNSTIGSKDYDGNSVIDLVISRKLSNDIVTEVLTQLLGQHTNEETLSQAFSYAWTNVVQLDYYMRSIQNILESFPKLIKELGECRDENGRLAVNIASPLCRKAIQESAYFLRRYDFGKHIYPTHISETSIVYIATDTNAENEDNNKSSTLSNDCQNIIPIIESYTSENNLLYSSEIKKRNLEKYEYCIVMPAGEKNLGNIIATERIAGKDFLAIQSITNKLVIAIKELHNKEYIHGDIKPLNVMRMGNDITLIDLDSSAKVGIDYYGIKYSQAYTPPEMLYKDEYGDIQMRSHNLNKSSIRRMNSVQLLQAHYSQDSWSLGILLFELFTGMSFFPKDDEDNIDKDSLRKLFEFNDEFKMNKLERITNKLARNLVSLLLMKDPSKRLSMSRVLEHPFLTNKVTPRLIGENAEYDVFLSYRVEADFSHANIIYDLLTSEGLKVWWDKKSLSLGTNWENGCSEGLVKSLLFLPVISRNTLNNTSDYRSNITLLDENSACDNVLLEYKLALELQERGLISYIYPILIGDLDIETNEYNDYFVSGCYPNGLKDIVVKSIDEKVSSHLDSLGLGSTLTDFKGIKSILDHLFKCQGILLKGEKDTAFGMVVKDIKGMVANIKKK